MSDPKRQSPVVLCGDVSCFADDIHTTCADCGTAIVHRPHAPPFRKLCRGCVAVRMARAALAGEAIRPMVTRRTVDEVRLLHAKPGGSA